MPKIINVIPMSDHKLQLKYDTDEEKTPVFTPKIS